MMSSEETKVFGQSPNKQHLPNSSAFSILLPHSSPNTGEKKKLFFPSTRTAPHYLTAGIHQERTSVARGSGKIRLPTGKTSKSRSTETKPEDGTAQKIRFQILCHDRAWFPFSFMSRRHPGSWQAPAGPVLPTSFCLPPQILERLTSHADLGRKDRARRFLRGFLSFVFESGRAYVFWGALTQKDEAFLRVHVAVSHVQLQGGGVVTLMPLMLMFHFWDFLKSAQLTGWPLTGILMQLVKVWKSLDEFHVNYSRTPSHPPSPLPTWNKWPFLGKNLP